MDGELLLWACMGGFVGLFTRGCLDGMAAEVRALLAARAAARRY